jgi:urease accessory protein UreH
VKEVTIQNAMEADVKKKVEPGASVSRSQREVQTLMQRKLSARYLADQSAELPDALEALLKHLDDDERNKLPKKN